MARIGSRYSDRYLGVFDSLEEASSVYEAAAAERGGKFYRKAKI